MVHYSTINVVMIIFAMIFDTEISRYIRSYLICNTFGTVCTWYSAVVIDPTIPTRMMQKHGWNIIQFILGDIGLHIAPLMWATYHIRREHLSPAHELSRHCGLYSLFTNILWCLCSHHSFDPQHSYIHQPYQVWNDLWALCVCFHLVPMLYMQRSSTVLNLQ